MKSKTKKKSNFINVDKYFNRKFEFINDGNWNLCNNIYVVNKFTIPEFQERKTELNAAKEQLSNFNLLEWSKYTKGREPSTSIISTIRRTYKAELVTQAWCKFYECLHEYPVISENIINAQHLNSVHLCEAPGAFICALNHYLKTYYSDIKWNWLGTTLNPYYEGNSEMIPDDRLIRYTHDNWHFGLDLTGDITKYYNHKSLVDFVKGKWKVQLVTADGSIDCMDNPGDQEKIVEFLHYCETMSALQILEAGGSFIMKIFTMFEESTICLMYLLNSCFEKVHVFKPCSSKSGNSELYVICLNYKPLNQSLMSAIMMPYTKGKLEKSMFPLNQISETFLAQIFECGLYFMEKQIKVINENVRYFKKMDNKQLYWVKNLSKRVVTCFQEKYNITTIPNELKIVQNNNIGNNMYYIAEYFLVKEKDYKPYVQLEINEIYPVDITSLLHIQIGQRMETVVHSKYHTITNYSYSQNGRNKDLYNLVLPLVTRNNIVIAFSDFKHSYGVSNFHKIFFAEIFKKLTYEKNFLLVGVPLLTNFLVGLIFIISKAFKRMWFLNNVIVLEKPERSKMEMVRKYLEAINETYLMINSSTDCFTKDILYLVPLRFIYNRKYIKLISNYNDSILAYKTISF